MFCPLQSRICVLLICVYKIAERWMFSQKNGLFNTVFCFVLFIAYSIGISQISFFFLFFSAHNAYSSIHNHSIVEEYSSLLEGTQRWVTNQPNTSDNPYEDCSRKRSLNITAIAKEIASELSHPSIQTFCLGVGCNT